LKQIQLFQHFKLRALSGSVGRERRCHGLVPWSFTISFTGLVKNSAWIWSLSSSDRENSTGQARGIFNSSRVESKKLIKRRKQTFEK
jgi:hypothetical protein